MRRRRPRSSRVLLVMSVIVAAGASVVLRDHLARLEARAAEPGDARPLLVAARPLARGTVLEPGMVAARKVPERYQPPGALAAPKEAVGRTLGDPVMFGEPITATRLAPPGGPVAALVPPGFRAVTVTTGLPEGLLAPGDRVDVLATYATGPPRTESVVSRAEVLRVLPASAPEGVDVAVTVVLLVWPSDAERIAFARAFADISLTVAPAAEPPS